MKLPRFPKPISTAHRRDPSSASPHPWWPSLPLHRVMLAASLLAFGVSVAAQADLAQLPGAPMSAQAAAAKSKLSATELWVPAPFSGAVYVGREKDQLHLWVVDIERSTILREHAIRFDPRLDQVIAFEFGPDVTGVFLADDLVQPGDQQRFAFRGELLDGRVAMPLPAAAFAPLWSLDVPGELVPVTPDQADRVALLAAQAELYRRVADVGQLHLELVERFRSDMQAELQTLHDLHVEQAALGRSKIDAASSAAQRLHDRFLAQAGTDEGLILAAAQSFEGFGAGVAARFEREVQACLQAVHAQGEKQLTELQQVVAQAPEDESGSDRIEASIAASEAELQRMPDLYAQCANLAGIETYAPAIAVDENGAGYAAIDADAQAVEAESEAALNAWGAALEAQIQAQADRVENTTVATEALAYRDYFSEWLSPTWSDERFDAALDRAQASKSAPWVAYAPAKGEEQLCKNETWNFEFNLAGISVVFATPWNDHVVTGNGHNLIFTFRGDDCIESHAGYDAVFAGPGRDRIYGGDDHDFLFGGRDDDQIHGSAGNTYTVTAGPVVLDFDIGNLIVGQAGSDALFGGEVTADRGENGSVDNHGYADLILADSFLFGGAAGNDTVQGEMGVDFIFGQAGDDSLSNLVPGVIGINGIPVPFGSFFFGNDGNDFIAGSNTSIAGVFPLMGDFIFGNAGNDTAQANAGQDFVFGNTGNDQLDGGRDTDFVFGNAGNDTVAGNDGSDLLFGNDGDDTVFGSPGLVDLIFGGEGNDRLFGNDGVDIVFGANGSDTIQGNDGFDLIFGGPAADTINGNAGVDLAFGGAGEDLINGDDGIDLLFGNRDSDTVNGGDGFDVIFGNDNSQKTETLSGNGGADLIFGNEGDDRIFGNDGIDLLFGNRGIDSINGNAGVDLIFGNESADVLRGDDGPDLIFGNADSDNIAGGNGIDVLFGNEGCDIIAGDADADVVFGNDGKDRIWGGDGLDLLFGNAGTDDLRGENGPDLLFGGEYNDSLQGGDGLDLLTGGDGDDFLLGGNGIDILLGGAGADFGRGDAGNDAIFGADGNDTLDGAGDGDLVMGQNGNDAINSGGGTDTTFGNDGADRLRAVEGTNFAFGNSGNDTLDGYSTSTPDPRDFLFGNSNNDVLTGNSSNQRDIRTGGGGSDTKHWNQTHVAASLFNGSWNGNSICN
jgi:Ca2+-binding RTX toxin-like protein